MAGRHSSRPTRPHRLKRIGIAWAAVAALGVATIAPVGAQSDEPTPEQVVIFIIDLSGSMNEPLDGELTKLDVAKEGFIEAFDKISPTAQVGLLAYGSGADSTSPANRESNCLTDSETVQPVGPLERDLLISQVQDFEARGDTLIAKALEDAAGAVPPDAFATVVLFSDGRDECFDADLDGDPGVGPSWGNDPCDVARRLAGQGIDLRIDDLAPEVADRIDRVDTVGFLPDAAAEAELRCIAEETGGSFTSISTLQEARDVLPGLLVDLGSPPEVEPPGGEPITAGANQAAAAALPRLEATANARFVDDIEMGGERWYRVDNYGPGEGTFTATVFGLPAEEGITFDFRMELPATDQAFFTNQGNDNAGLPRSGSRSIRCPGCSLTGSEAEVFWVVSLASTNANLDGTYDLELLLEGPGFGGLPTNCQEPQECWYEGEAAARTTQIADLQTQLDEQLVASGAGPLVARRGGLRDEVEILESELDTASAKRQELEAQAEALGGPSANFTLPLAFTATGLVPAAAGLVMLRRRPRGSVAGLDPADAGPPEAPVPPVDIGEDPLVIGRVVGSGQTTSPAPGALDLASFPPPSVPVPSVPVPSVPVPSVPATPSDADDWLGASQLAIDEAAGGTNLVGSPDPLPGHIEVETVSGEATAGGAMNPDDGAEETVVATGPAADGTVVAPETTAVAPDWYQDPEDPSRYRWWDGVRWGQQAPSGEEG